MLGRAPIHCVNSHRSREIVVNNSFGIYNRFFTAVYWSGVLPRPTKFRMHIINILWNAISFGNNYRDSSPLSHTLSLPSGILLFFISLFFARFCMQVPGKRHLHTRYQVLERCMQSRRHVHGAIYRYAAVIRHIVNICHIANSWSSISKHGNGVAARPTSISAWNSPGNSSMHVKLKAMREVWWICTTIGLDER